MAVPTLEIVLESGETIEEDRESSRFSVEIPGLDGQYAPVLTNEIEIETSPENTVRRDQCGNTERRKTTNDGWNVRVTGFVSPNTGRQDNLALPILRDELAQADSVFVYSDIFNGRIVVSNVVITQASDNAKAINADWTDGFEDVYRFQLQLGEQEAEN